MSDTDTMILDRKDLKAMPKITFIEHDGTQHTVEAEIGSTVMETAVKNDISSIVAECGGMLALLDGIVPHAQPGQDTPEPISMWGLLPGQAAMQKRMVNLGMHAADLPEGPMRGHTFHHSLLDSQLEPALRGTCPNAKPVAEAVFRLGRLTASYIHFYLPSNPAAAAAIFRP